FRTPVDYFYRIDTALTVPQLNPDTWKLRISGMVERPLTLTYADLLARPLVERWITLACVSNEVGGELIGNATFRGVLLADLLREAGISPASDQLVATSSDGMTIGSPTAVVTDGRDAMLAVGMNGEVLSTEHGFPVRMVVPGLYGYVSACKWITGLRATTFSDYQAYWVRGGWAARGPVKLASRIDRPVPPGAVKVGEPVPVAGVAWDQHVGVSKVEVQVDDGPWQQATLAPVPSVDTWRQWVYLWTPQSPGQHRLRVRAFDQNGTAQDARDTDPFPSGATGLHSVTVRAAR
ncbi:molybdopterin-dependent oxidoreductase, partial [Jatrophihabitans sp.]|uniref:molybdopterin-dependent oxidoreductase n=1 Tax=Jatrophihabitans sp. TaxID=1932789 RepID=UPI002F2535B3